VTYYQELRAALYLQLHRGTYRAACYLRVKGWSLESALRILT
jgi:hypothetical protein